MTNILSRSFPNFQSNLSVLVLCYHTTVRDIDFFFGGGTIGQHVAYDEIKSCLLNCIVERLKNSVVSV